METTHFLLGLLSGIVIGTILLFVALRRARQKADNQAAKIAEIASERDIQTAKAEAADKRIAEIKEEHRFQLEELKQQHREALNYQMNTLKEQLTTASEDVLAKRAAQLDNDNRKQLSIILTPLQTDIKQMREAVEKSDRAHNATMERLDASIKASLASSQELGERADRLSNALIGDNKLQGNFGELRLKQLLDEMGLQEGLQYDLQSALRDAHGNVVKPGGQALIPDVTLHFPDHRDVIIDSKMSWVAYEDYCSATDEKQRADALRRHIASIRNHIDELSRKNYSKYTNGARLDFVLMYMFSGNALHVALINDNKLYKYGYDKGVILSDSHSLYMTLRLLEIAWRQQHQFENQQEIMAAADQIVERVQILSERFQAAHKSLDKAQETFAAVERSLSPSGQSITVAAQRLLRYGAKESGKRGKLTPPAGDILDIPSQNDATAE